MGKRDPVFDQSELEKAIDLAIDMGKLEPVNINSAEDIQERVDMYLYSCRGAGVPPDVAGLANALGLKRKELLQLAESGVNDPRVNVLIRALTQINAVVSSLSKREVINPTMAIMDLANDFGYSRQGDVIIEKPRDERMQSAEQIAQKYAGLIAETSVLDAEVIEKKPRKGRKRSAEKE